MKLFTKIIPFESFKRLPLYGFWIANKKNPIVELGSLEYNINHPILCFTAIHENRLHIVSFVMLYIEFLKIVSNDQLFDSNLGIFSLIFLLRLILLRTSEKR